MSQSRSLHHDAATMGYDPVTCKARLTVACRSQRVTASKADTHARAAGSSGLDCTQQGTHSMAQTLATFGAETALKPTATAANDPDTASGIAADAPPATHAGRLQPPGCAPQTTPQAHLPTSSDFDDATASTATPGAGSPSAADAMTEEVEPEQGCDACACPACHLCIRYWPHPTLVCSAVLLDNAWRRCHACLVMA